MYFAVFRLAFLMLLFSLHPAEEMIGWTSVFYHGLRLDLASTGYLLLLPLLTGGLSLYTGKQWLWKTAALLQAAEMIIISIVTTGNLALYKAWGTMLNYRAVQFLRDPDAIVASLSNLQIILLAALLSAVSLLLLKLSFKLLIAADQQPKDGQLRWWVPVCLILMPLMMRGGIQQIPVNESSAFFSEQQHLNHVATNPVWYLVNNWIKSSDYSRDDYTFMSDAEAKKRLDEFQPSFNDPDKILAIERPNIVLIVLESWSADFVGPLGGDPAATPFFNSLCDSGLLFTNIYSSGRRTDQMFPSILSGYPAQPNHSISRHSDKLSQLPMLPEDLKSAGYSTLFHYGGELGFGNMKSYLLEAGFSSITGKDAFSDDQTGSKWGAHDQYLFEKQLSDLDSSAEPFFSMALTLSSHEPFEVPGRKMKSSAGERERFREAVNYTDECLRRFMQMASSKKWFGRTLFILVADHGHHLPGKRDYYDPACYRIPLLFYGPALKPELRGNKNPVTGSQHYLPPTLLHQLDINKSRFEFSNNLLNENQPSFAYLNFDNAFGCVSGNERFVYLYDKKAMHAQYTHLNDSSGDRFILHGKAFLQMLYKDFISR